MSESEIFFADSLSLEERRELRAPTYPKIVLGDLLERRINSDNTVDVEYGGGSPLTLAPLRIDLGYPYGGSLFDELYKFHDSSGNVMRAAIFFGAGATKSMVTIDREGRFALGDEFHEIEYSPDEDGYIGRLGGGRYALDALGRAYLDLGDLGLKYDEDDPDPAYEPVYCSSAELSPLDKAVRSILEAH